MHRSAQYTKMPENLYCPYSNVTQFLCILVLDYCKVVLRSFNYGSIDVQTYSVSFKDNWSNHYPFELV